MSGADLRVIKLGGSLLGWPEWPARLHSWLTAQTPAANVLVVGGGALADVVREWDRVRLVGFLGPLASYSRDEPRGGIGRTSAAAGDTRPRSRNDSIEHRRSSSDSRLRTVAAPGARRRVAARLARHQRLDRRPGGTNAQRSRTGPAEVDASHSKRCTRTPRRVDDATRTRRRVFRCGGSRIARAHREPARRKLRRTNSIAGVPALDNDSSSAAPIATAARRVPLRVPPRAAESGR